MTGSPFYTYRWNRARREMPIERVLFFGDPILVPERVVVWAIYPERRTPVRPGYYWA